MPTDLKPYLKKIVDYLNRKKVWEHGFVKYSTLKRMIVHITKLQRPYIIRKLFITLVEQDYFIKKKNLCRSYNYKFKNQNEIKQIVKQITINFN